MKNERKTQHTKAWDELTFADNFLFCKILEDDPEICRQLLELLLHVKIDRLEPPQSERTMQETLGDRAYKVFFNAANCDKLESEEERSFFRFLKGGGADTAFSRRIAERVAFAKQDMTWRRQYMTWQQTIDEEKAIAFEEGAQQNARENAWNLLRMNLCTPEQIAQAIRIPLEDVLALKEEVSRERGG